MLFSDSGLKAVASNTNGVGEEVEFTSLGIEINTEEVIGITLITAVELSLTVIGIIIGIIQIVKK